MSSSGHTAQYFEVAHRVLMSEVDVNRFFERLKSFREGLVEAVDVGRQYGFRQQLADLQTQQFRKLLNEHGGATRPLYQNRFLKDMVLTPELFHKMSLLVELDLRLGDSSGLGERIARSFLTKIEAMEITSEPEIAMLRKSLRLLACALDGTDLPHEFADLFFNKVISGEVRADIPFVCFLNISGPLDASHAENGMFKGPITAPTSVSSNAHAWLIKNEVRLVEFFKNGNLVVDFSESLAEQADLYGYSQFANVIRLRQLEYQPSEILENARHHGVHPDERCVELLEKKAGYAGIQSVLNSDAALMAYRLVNIGDIKALGDGKMARHSFRLASVALTEQGLGPAPEMLDKAKEMAAIIIERAVNHQGLEWMADVEYLQPVLLASKKYQGMRLESDLGL